jgi:YspA, cpYpsA-related SLOG family
MPITFADQLAGLDLAGFSIGPAPVSTTDFPVREAVVQTLEAVWSDLFALVSGTALEADAEDLGWAFVNLFHRSAERKSGALDRATDEVRALVATADGSEIHTSELEAQVERAQCAEASMLALEEMREVAACLYLNEFGSSWKPVSSSRFNHGAMLTSALVEGRDFLRARAESKRRAAMPEGTPVVFAGGRTRHDTEADALTFANNVWATLDKVRDRVPDMVLIHGGDTKGVDRLASSWAERRNISQVTFSLDMRLGARAGFKRNERMLSLDPRYVVAFPGNGVLERLVIEAKARRITVVDRRGPLGTNPKAVPG